jgi:histidinol-phosphate phosphatase family protein
MIQEDIQTVTAADRASGGVRNPDPAAAPRLSDSPLAGNLPGSPLSKAVFLDRDGTLARDIHYCRRPEDLELLPTVAEGLRLLARLDYKIIVITNQSGIARGYFTEDTLSRIHEKMLQDIRQAGGRIDAVYYCPHHPDDACACRKPQTGLLQQAAREWNLDLSQSYFIGDKFLDMQAANKVNCKAVIVPNTPPETDLLEGKNDYPEKLHYISPDFINAAKWIEKDSAQRIKVTMVVPTRNEALNLGEFLPQISEEIQVLVVDGQSTDGTPEVARKLRPSTAILTQTGRGKGNAMKQGFAAAAGEYIVTFDADGSFSLAEVARFVEPLINGYDLVKGSRFIHGAGTSDMPFVRRFGNWCFVTFANLLFGTRYTDLAYGYHAFRKSAVQKLDIRSDGFEIDTELYLKAHKYGLRVLEVPSYEGKRKFGQGNLKSLSDGWRILKMILKVRFGK